MKKNILKILLIVLLLVVSGCVTKKEEEKKIEPASLDKVIEDLISYKNNKVSKSVIATIIMEGIYVKDGVTYNYYSITKLEVMTFKERAKLFYDIDGGPQNVYVVLADKLKAFYEYTSIDDLVENGMDASDGIGVCTEVYNVENGEIVCTDGGNLKSIEVKTAPTKLNYVIGDEKINLTGLVVKGTYIDGTTKVETVTEENLTGFDTTTAGIKTITVNISGRKSTFLIRVEESILESIEITTLPTKLDYIVEQYIIDLTGLVVTGNYSDGSKKIMDVTSSNISGAAMGTTGEKIITVTIGDKKATFNVMVYDKSLDSISIKTNPTKTTYYVGDSSINLTGLVVMGNYNNDTTSVQTITASNISGFNTTTSGSKTITVTVSGKTATFPITVLDVVLNSISVATQPTKTTYYVGDSTINLSGLVVTGTYNNGTTSAQTITTSNISGFNTTTSGSKIITVTVSGETATFPITVVDVVLCSISVTTQPTKTNYYVGDSTISLSGLVVTGTYNNGTTSAQTITTANISGFSTTTSGSKTVTVTVSGKTATFPITVADAIVSAAFTLTKTIDILKLKQYSATFEVADTSIKTLVLTGDGGVSPGEIMLTGTTATVSKLVTDTTITKITVQALDANGNQVGSTKTITLN